MDANEETEVLELLSSEPADQEQIEQEAGAGAMYQLVLEMDLDTWKVRLSVSPPPAFLAFALPRSLSSDLPLWFRLDVTGRDRDIRHQGMSVHPESRRSCSFSTERLPMVLACQSSPRSHLLLSISLSFTKLHDLS